MKGLGNLILLNYFRILAVKFFQLALKVQNVIKRLFLTEKSRRHNLVSETLELHQFVQHSTCCLNETFSEQKYFI